MPITSSRMGHLRGERDSIEAHLTIARVALAVSQSIEASSS